MGGKVSAASKNKWMAKAYDRVNLTMPKGRKEEVKTHAEARGESVNGFINRAISETMERDEQRIEELLEFVEPGDLEGVPREQKKN